MLDAAAVAGPRSGTSANLARKKSMRCVSITKLFLQLGSWYVALSQVLGIKSLGLCSDSKGPRCALSWTNSCPTEEETLS